MGIHIPINKKHMLRQQYLQRIQDAFRTHKVVALLGPRQCGKTTIANDFIANIKQDFAKRNYFDLEKNTDIVRLMNPQLSLEQLDGLIVIDEIQRQPELFPTIRVLVDQCPSQRYLILGSA